MSGPKVNIITINEPIFILGKHFTGSYFSSPKYVQEVQEMLKRENIEFVPFKVMGIFYDNPQLKAENELRSFHGVFPEKASPIDHSALERFELKGQFLQVMVKGDPSKSIMEGYQALFAYIQQNGIQLKSTAGYQINSFENGEITTEILMEC